MFQPREKDWFSIVSPNIAVAPRRNISSEWKRDRLLSTPIVGRPQVVAARVETLHHWETLPRSKDPPKHMLRSRSYSAQFFQARFMENIDLLHRRVFHILDPQRASGREEDGVGVPRGDFQVILKTPVWSSREGMGSFAKYCVSNGEWAGKLVRGTTKANTVVSWVIWLIVIVGFLFFFFL